jgi:GTP-binding protein
MDSQKHLSATDFQYTIHSVEHITANTDPGKCPPPDKPEYAFIGRSNVGKSSLINMLVNRKGLARISGSPGKTRTINHYLVNQEWYIVDLPGYGYAKVAKTERGKWVGFTDKYLRDRTNLMCLFVLVDGRIEPQSIDLDFINHLGRIEIPFLIVLTKTEKIPVSQLKKNIAVFQSALSETWVELPRMVVTSAVSRTGRSELMLFIQQTNLLFNQS